jgi:hypothetical protein
VDLGGIIPQSLEVPSSLFINVLDGIPLKRAEVKADHPARVGGDKGEVVAEFGIDLYGKGKDVFNDTLMKVD